MKKYKIVAIAQIHNELRKGHLERFFKFLKPLVEAIIVYDDASTDGSWEYARRQTPYVIRGIKNDFANELAHKDIMLKKALELRADFVLSIDADEVVSDSDGSKLQDLADWIAGKNLDGARIRDINLWRSTSWARTDNDFDSAKFLRFWRVKPGMTYGQPKPGLHQSPAPPAVRKVKETDIVSLLHFGFATDRSIIAKYLTYAKHGQKGPNLSRLLDESELSLRPVNSELFPQGLYIKDPKPIQRPLVEWLKLAEELSRDLLRPAVSIVALIYQSTDWLKFCYEQVLKYTNLADKEFFFVANDATQEVKEYLKASYIPHYIFENTKEHKQEWYINNVYRAWNYAAKMARGDYILFINSDMAFSPNWVEDAFKALNGSNCVSSRLAESGKLMTGRLANGDACFESNFGKFVDEYKEQEFLKFAKSIQAETKVEGGPSMPLLIKRQDFWDVEGYPEGNVVKDSNPFSPKIAKKGEDLLSGDVILMQKLKSKGIIHETTFESLVYHFQEGEMSSTAEDVQEKNRTEIILVNSALSGRMNEKVMWNFLLEGLPVSAGVDIKTIGSEDNFENKVREYIGSQFPGAKIIIQNASYMDIIHEGMLTIAFLQDNLRRMGRMSPQQENNLEKANFLVTNSVNTAASYPEFHFKIIPIGVNDHLFKPGNKMEARKINNISGHRVGIFVGDLTEVKGWPKVKRLIQKHSEITWVVVSKDDEQYQASNVKMYNHIEQEQLASLYRCADFFILGSPVETQCLAAMEACFTNIPVIMHNVGIFMDLSEHEREKCGIFGEDFETALRTIQTRDFSPREVMLARGWNVEGMANSWWRLIAEIKLRGDSALSRKGNFLLPKPVSKIKGFRKNLSMVLGNKNYIHAYLKKQLPGSLYRFIIKVWRLMKNIKRKVI